MLTGWEEAVGPQIAAHARPSHIANHRLTVVTESPVWTQQLSLLKPELLRRIAGRFGPGVVTDLYFVTGEDRARAPPAPARGEAGAGPGSLPADLEKEIAGDPRRRGARFGPAPHARRARGAEDGHPEAGAAPG